MTEMLTSFAGKYIALVDNRIVASGNSQLEIYNQAHKLFPSKIVTLEYIPTKEETLTFL